MNFRWASLHQLFNTNHQTTLLIYPFNIIQSAENQERLVAYVWPRFNSNELPQHIAPTSLFSLQKDSQLGSPLFTDLH